MKKYFGTDGVRGIANTELTNTFAYQTGRAIVKRLRESLPVGGDRISIAVGRDTRLSGPMLMMALSAGVMAEGGDVLDLGVLSTPGVAFMTRFLGADMGVVISASHNPYPYNGIKLINREGYKLDDAEEAAIEEVIDGLDPETRDGEDIGSCRNCRADIEAYRRHILSLAGDGFAGMRIAIDAGDGVMSGFAEEIFKALGAETTVIYNDGNGRLINDNSGSTNPEKVGALVRATHSDIGVSFDGDADRVIFSDEHGEVIDGDHLIAYAAESMVAEGTLSGSGVVTTTMSNGAFERYLRSRGIALIRADVGDKYVMQEMVKNGLVLGGEQSGHIIFLQHHTMGDGLQTAVLAIAMLRRAGENASAITNLYRDDPQVLLNAKASADLKKSYRERPLIAEAIRHLETEHPECRLLIRPSGTENYIRVMVEGPDADVITREAEKIRNCIEKEL